MSTVTRRVSSRAGAPPPARALPSFNRVLPDSVNRAVGAGGRGCPCFRQADVLGGQAVIVIGSQPPGASHELWIVATTVPGTGKITGITCGIGGEDVTPTGARDAVTSLYWGYVTARRREELSPQDALARLTLGGPEAGYPYLQQVRYAIARRHLGDDPVTCGAAGLPEVSARTTRVVAGGSVGVVLVSAHRTQFLVTVVLGAKGWTVGDIACFQ